MLIRLPLPTPPRPVPLVCRAAPSSLRPRSFTGLLALPLSPTSPFSALAQDGEAYRALGEEDPAAARGGEEEAPEKGQAGGDHVYEAEEDVRGTGESKMRIAGLET